MVIIACENNQILFIYLFELEKSLRTGIVRGLFYLNVRHQILLTGKTIGNKFVQH